MSWHKIHNSINGQAYRFSLLLEQPEQTQKDFLKNLVSLNKDTEFGIQHDFDSITSIESFQKNVAIQSYSKLENDIDRMMQRENNILCSETVISFERTGGSSGGNKYIPYTNASLKSFHAALYPWLDDLLTNRPGIKKGSLYWSISPSLKDESYKPAQQSTEHSNDADYFGPVLAQEFSKLIITPESVSQLHDYQTWQYFTLRYLLAADDLTFISVWSPTFLLDLMTCLLNNYKQLSSDINQGEISIKPGEYNHDQHPLLLKPDPLRAEAILQSCSKNHINSTLLWPVLDTISCWQDATSKQFIPQLKNMFNQVYFQAKGLIATEGVISTPLCEHETSVLAINSSFFEFMDTSGNILLAHELSTDKTYHVIISNFSGLYRYKLGDCIKVTGFAGRTPLIEFIGRHGMTSDLCGEKLTEVFVQQQLEKTDGFIMLMPQPEANRGYLLIVDVSQYSKNEADSLAADIDNKLMKNPQYAYARKINQLAPLKTFRSKNPWKKYIKHESTHNRKIGDIKPCCLYTDADFLKLIITDA